MKPTQNLMKTNTVIKQQSEGLLPYLMHNFFQKPFPEGCGLPPAFSKCFMNKCNTPKGTTLE